jgi:hypothetical protein
LRLTWWEVGDGPARLACLVHCNVGLQQHTRRSWSADLQLKPPATKLSSQCKGLHSMLAALAMQHTMALVLLPQLVVSMQQCCAGLTCSSRLAACSSMWPAQVPSCSSSSRQQQQGSWPNRLMHIEGALQEWRALPLPLL